MTTSSLIHLFHEILKHLILIVDPIWVYNQLPSIKVFLQFSAKKGKVEQYRVRVKIHIMDTNNHL